MRARGDGIGSVGLPRGAPAARVRPGAGGP
jgi:hypothetical protein